MGLIPDKIKYPPGLVGVESLQVEIHPDLIAEKLDELADLAEYWKKNRDKGRMPTGIRAGMIHLAKDITVEYLESEPDTSLLINKTDEKT